jgi:hypothetical protein
MEENLLLKSFAQKLTEINTHIQKMHIELLRHALFVETTLLGILVSLYNGNNSSFLSGVVFATLSILLSIGILLAAVSLYAEVYYLKKAKDKLVLLSIEGYKDHRLPEPAVVKPRKIFLFCTIAAYAGFVLSILLLAFYAILVVYA